MVFGAGAGATTATQCQTEPKGGSEQGGGAVQPGRRRRKTRGESGSNLSYIIRFVELNHKLLGIETRGDPERAGIPAKRAKEVYFSTQA